MVALAGAEYRARSEVRAGRDRLGLVVRWVRASAAEAASWDADAAGGRATGLGRAEEVVVAPHSSARMRMKMSTNDAQIIVGKY